MARRKDPLCSAIKELSISTSDNSSILQEIRDILINLLAEPDFEIKTFPPIKYCCPDGSIYLSVICQKYQDNTLISTEVVYIDSTGIINSLPSCAEPCTEEDICNAWLGGGLGSSLPIELITDLTLIIPECNCSGILNTSIGQIPFDNIRELCIPSIDCPYSISDITLNPESTCSLEDIKWYAARKK